MPTAAGPWLKLNVVLSTLAGTDGLLAARWAYALYLYDSVRMDARVRTRVRVRVCVCVCIYTSRSLLGTVENGRSEPQRLRAEVLHHRCRRGSDVNAG